MTESTLPLTVALPLRGLSYDIVSRDPRLALLEDFRLNVQPLLEAGQSAAPQIDYTTGNVVGWMVVRGRK